MIAAVQFMLLVGASTLVVHTVRRRRARHATADAQRTALVDGIEMLIILIGAGCSPARALEELITLAPAPLRPALADVQHQRSRGRSLADALSVLPVHLGAGVIPVVDALRAAHHYGTPLGPALDRIGDHMRHERRALAEARVRTLGVRITFPLVVCILPAFAIGALAPVLIGALSALDNLGSQLLVPPSRPTGRSQ